MMIKVRVQRLPHGADLDLPAYATPGSAGMDLRAALEEDFVLWPGRYTMVPTGLALALPEGFEAQIRPRSGLAAKFGITVLNSPGTVDADYRGEVKIGLINLGDRPYTVNRGDRIAQLVLAPVFRAMIIVVDDLDKTDRQDGGFGHTGI